jgi:phosphopantothenoylcysteine decarboxylase/phosphopantothenate--cysteine ligase
MDLEMERTTDILATVAGSPDRPGLVVGFAAETEAVEQNARGKLLKKNLDMIAANEVGDSKAFECEDNHLIVLSRTARHDLGQAPKIELAKRLVELIAAALAERATTPASRSGATAIG